MTAGSLYSSERLFVLNEQNNITFIVTPFPIMNLSNNDGNHQ